MRIIFTFKGAPLSEVETDCIPTVGYAVDFFVETPQGKFQKGEWVRVKIGETSPPIMIFSGGGPVVFIEVS